MSTSNAQYTLLCTFYFVIPVASGRTTSCNGICVVLACLCRKKKDRQTGVRTRDSLNLVRVRYRYATQPVVGGIINSNSLSIMTLQLGLIAESVVLSGFLFLITGNVILRLTDLTVYGEFLFILPCK